MTKITQNVNKGSLIKQPYEISLEIKQSINSADIDCWKFEWDQYIAFTLHYKPLGVSDTKIGERLAIYHEQTGVLLKVVPLSTMNDEQIASITITGTMDIQYTNASRAASFKYAEIFNIPSAYTDSIS